MTEARGFTLMEVMVAIAITAMIGAMLGGSFQRAYATKETVEAQNERYAGARLALGRMGREISMAFLSNHFDTKRYRERPTIFRGKDSGTRDALLFATMAHDRLTRDAKQSDQMVVEYYLDSDPDAPGEEALYRREKPVIDDEPDHGGTKAKLCDHVTGLDISYWDWKKQEWADEWSSASTERQGWLPPRVRIKLTLKMDDGKDKTFETQTRIAIIRPLDF